MRIAVDFYGTCTKHDYPRVGEDTPFAESVIKRLVKEGHRIILYTMRSGKELEDAEQWFIDKGIPLYGVNVEPNQHTWTASPKCDFDLTIDDKALGTPLIFPIKERAYVNWLEVEKILEKQGVLSKK